MGIMPTDKVGQFTPPSATEGAAPEGPAAAQNDATNFPGAVNQGTDAAMAQFVEARQRALEEQQTQAVQKAEDAGFLGKLVGAVEEAVSVVGGAVGGLVVGGPAGAVAGGLLGAEGGGLVQTVADMLENKSSDQNQTDKKQGV